MNAACTGCSVSPCARPSIVVTARGPSSTAGSMHDATGAPSSQTVQAEQAPRSQPILVPVRSSGPRSTSASVTRGSTFTARATPLTVKVSDTTPGPTIAGSSAATALRASPSSAMLPAATPAPPRNDRRDTADAGQGSDMSMLPAWMRAHVRAQALPFGESFTTAARGLP